MTNHIFLQEQRVEAADLHAVLDLSATGQLEWGPVPGLAVMGTNVDYSLGRETAMRRNLLEVRVSFIPDGITSLNYLLMKDAAKQSFEVDSKSEEELVLLATRVLKVGELALRIPGGRLSGTMEDCGNCERPTGHLSVYTAVHGIRGAVLAGSERHGCVACD